MNQKGKEEIGCPKKQRNVRSFDFLRQVRREADKELGTVDIRRREGRGGGYLERHVMVCADAIEKGRSRVQVTAVALARASMFPEAKRKMYNATRKCGQC